MENPASAFPSRRGYHPHPPVVPSNGGAPEVGRQGPWASATCEVAQGVHHPSSPARYRLRHRLRGRPTLHPEGCSSSCFSSSSMPSRMNDEAFLYLVYGTSSLMNSHVAWSMRKVTTRDFAFTRSLAG